MFYEALSLVTYPLVSHKQTDEARAGARKYIIYLLGAAKLGLLTALILIYNLTGDLGFNNAGVFAEDVVREQPTLLFVIFALCLFGFAKNAIMPMHSWLPAARVAPNTP